MRLAGRNEVGDGRLEGAGARGSEEEHVALGPADLAEAARARARNGQEVGAAVVNHRRADGGEHLGGHGRRPRREEVALRHVRTVALYSAGMDALVAFGAALLTFRLAGLLAARYRASTGRTPKATRNSGRAAAASPPPLPAPRTELLAWSAGLAAYAVAAAAIAWGEAAGWDDRAFRVYYAAGALLTAPLLGAGSLLLAGRRRAAPVALVYVGLAVGVSLAVQVHGAFAAHGIPAAQDHLALVPARLLAIVANVPGTLAVVVVALRSLSAAPARQRTDRRRDRRRGGGQRARGLGAAGSAVGIAVGAVLLYAGFIVPAHISSLFRPKMAPR